MGTEQFKRDFVKEAVNGEPVELVRALVSIDDAQASFQILRLSAVSCLSHLLRTVPPSITQEASRCFDALIGWAVALIMAGNGAAAASLPTPEKVANDPSVCSQRTYLGHEALRHAHLPICSDAIKGAAYIGCQALVLGHVVGASAREKPAISPGTTPRPPDGISAH